MLADSIQCFDNDNSTKKGTKPTKYCILYDDTNHSIDDLEELSICFISSTNILCPFGWTSWSYLHSVCAFKILSYKWKMIYFFCRNERLNMSKLTAEWELGALHNKNGDIKTSSRVFCLKMCSEIFKFYSLKQIFLLFVM